MHDKILILDFGSQYTQLIARRVRELNVYCEILPYHQDFSFSEEIKGIILSGGPSSVLDKKAPKIEVDKLEQVPVLGICYGAQLLVNQRGGTISKLEMREYGRAKLTYKDENNLLLSNFPSNSSVWMSHGDVIVKIPDDFVPIGSTETVPIVAFKKKNKEIYGIQFHPEVTHTKNGITLLANFIQKICKARPEWTSNAFIKSSVKSLKEHIGTDKVILGLSGGVDSSVAAFLIHQSIDVNLHCIFVNNGLLRKNEYEEVLNTYLSLGLNVKGVDASQKFYKALVGIQDPEIKRKVIGKAFIQVFEEEAKLIQNAKWLAQGTIYPDVIESISVQGPSATIKSHHNVGGLPKKMKLKVIEPLRMLFKDEVRNIGKALNLPDNLRLRHPFPGPGLAIRILGEITKQKVKILQEADAIFIDELKAAKCYDKVWQAGTILLNAKSVGVMGDQRTYQHTVALRAVTSVDGMTADWSRLPHEFLATVSTKIINQVKGINRVVFDISSKPPATIEWE